MMSGNEQYKYADDTYIVVPAVNICSREAELENIEKRAARNNLKINRKKSLEIIFSGRELAFTFAICYRRFVCLSVVCLSVTLVRPTQPIKIIPQFFSPYDSPGTLVF